MKILLHSLSVMILALVSPVSVSSFAPTQKSSQATALKRETRNLFSSPTLLRSSKRENLFETAPYKTVQGGTVYTLPFPTNVQSVYVAIKTEGTPLHARVELLQGPSNKRQTMEVYTEDGLERPFDCILQSRGNGNVIRIVNTATIEYPIYAAVEPYEINDNTAGGGGEPLMRWN